MFLVFILILLSMNPLLAINSTECDKCILPEYGTARMKRHGGGKGGAKSRGVLRDDKGGGATTAAGGNATTAAGGNATTAAGGNATTAAGGNATTAKANATTRSPFLVEAAENTPRGGSVEAIDKHLPHPDMSKSCEGLYKTEKTSAVAIILYRSSGRLLCMGSIVDHLHILTSRRCISLAEPRDLRVVLGCSKPWWGRKSQIKKVAKVLNHEYEAALLRLKSKITYTKFVQPARFPSSANKGTKLTYLYTGPYYVLGYLVDRHGIPGDKVPKTLFYETKTDWYFELELCIKNDFQAYTLDPAKIFCTKGDMTFCWGAWGAPVMVYLNGHLIQIGVVVLDSCSSTKTGSYAMYRTDAYADWIKGHLKEIHLPT